MSWKGYVKVIYHTHLQNLNGSLSKIKGCSKSNFVYTISLKVVLYIYETPPGLLKVKNKVT